jgi:protein-S-isoprenylcysteine O-methyltransferase Ste14
MGKTMHRQLSLWALVLSLAIGGGGLVAMGLFILLGPPGWIDFGWTTPGDLGWNLFLSSLFFVQHSAMIRPGVRRRLVPWVPADYVKVLYSISSGVVLVTVVLLWQPAGERIVELTGLARWCVRLFALLALAGFYWTAKSLRDFDPLGVGAMLARMGAAPAAPMPLTVRGPYRWVRHPFYLFTLVMIWSYPSLSADRLLFNAVWTLWIWVGALLEERDLLAAYGPAYEAYRQNVPRLFPIKWK